MDLMNRARAWRAVARAAILVGASLAAGAASAWSNHALCTWTALSVLPEVTVRPPVRVESLASFVAADPAGLAALLRDEEAWARAHVPTYPARPDSLAFRAEAAPPAELVARFLAALRVNPGARLALYLQLPPGQTAGGRPTLREADVTVMKTDEAARLNTFVALRKGELVPAIDVIASASDEPDYGLDFGLWQDNGTAHGAVYGFGKQPFGNPAVEWSSQGPLHLGYFHEAQIVYKAAPFLLRAYPEYRIHLWRSLAAFALRTGHDYWAWRFAGWGLHYLQDLTQPYHARVLPGVSVPRMLWINTLDLAGVHGPRQDAVQLVTNRHFALENFERGWMREMHAAPALADVGREALRDTRLDVAAAYADDWPRHVVSKQASAAADALDAALVAGMPAGYTSDPKYVFGVSRSGVDLYAELAAASPERRESLKRAIAPLLGNVGSGSRAFVRSLMR
ncbi:MAG: hypothetical protein K8R60_20440 [Burkholderiales bacterium]|nr:hypothetical protein [Burkholderiales bacterium]